MAYTIKSHPGTYYSAHGDLIYVVYDSTNYTEDNFKYIASVYIGSTLVATVKKVPHPDNHFGIFNIGDIIRNYVASVFNPTAGQVVAQETGVDEFFTKATVYFTVDYFTIPAPEDPLTDGITVGEEIFFNHYNGRRPGSGTSLYLLQDKVVTNRPQPNYVGLTDNYSFISYLPTSTAPVTARITSWSGSTQQGIYDATITPSAANNLQILNIAPPAVNAAYPGLINAATTHYWVRVNSGNTYIFYITCEAVYTVYNLHFLNQYGGFESRKFTKISRKMVNITKTDFGKLPYTIDASGNVNYWNSNNVYNETRSVYASQYKEKMTLNTDVLTDEEYTWLGELVISPLVFIEMGNYFIPIAITATNYEYRKRINDKLTNLQLDIEFGEQFNAQYR